MKSHLLCICYLSISISYLSAQAADIEWENSVSGDFDVAANWNPGMVPGAADNALFNEAGAYDVTFTRDEFSQEVVASAGNFNFLSDSNTSRIYTISTDGDDVDVDVEVDATLRVGDVGTPVQLVGADAILAVGTASSSSVGSLIVDGDGSALTMLGTSRVHSIGGRGGRGILTIRDNAIADFGDGTLDIGVSNFNATSAFLSLRTGGQLLTNNLNIATNATDATGLATIDGATSVATVTNQAIVGGNSGGGGRIDIIGGGTLNVNDTTTVNGFGAINVTDGAFNASNEVLIDGGAFVRGLNGTFSLATEKRLNAVNGAQLTFEVDINTGNIIRNGTTFEVQSGADLTIENSIFRIADFSQGDGTLIVDGNGSTVTSQDFVIGAIWGGTHNRADVTFRNEAVGNFRDVVLSGGAIGTQGGGFVTVESGADVNVTGLRVASSFANQPDLARASLIVDGPGSTLTQSGPSNETIIIGKPGPNALNAEVIVRNDAVFTANTAETTILPTGRLRIETGGEYFANDNVHVNGGRLAAFGGQFHLGDNLTLTASQGALVDISLLGINNGTTYQIESGARLTTSGLSLARQGSGDGTLDVSGNLSSVRETGFGFATWGSDGNATATFRNTATGSLRRTLRLGASTGGDAELYVQTSAALTLRNDLEIGVAGNGNHLIRVESAGSVVQTDAAGVTIGRDSGTGSATVQVLSNASFTTGTGTTTLESTGRIEIGGGGSFHASTIDHTSGGQIELTEGTLSATTVDYSGDGVLNLFGGNLLVDVFNGDITNQGATIGATQVNGNFDNQSGTLAPGSSAGPTNITGDLTLQTGGVLSLEVGGTSPGGTHDIVVVAGAASIDGDLQLAIIDGFLPDPSDTFTVFSSNTLSGFFDNIFTGQRLDTIEGSGSFVVNYGIDSAFDPTQIVLSDFELTDDADFDNDGDVDGQDFLLIQRTSPALISLWEAQYGNESGSLASATAVPEPSGLVLCGLAIVLMISCQIKR